jgi:hypothetical protein
LKAPERLNRSVGSNPTLAAPPIVGQEVPLSAAQPARPAGAPAEQRFRLSARPPVRALAISSVAALVGAILLVVPVPAGWPTWVMLLGGLIMTLGVALAIIALVATRRLRCVLLLDPAGISVVRQPRSRTLAWSEIDNVTVRGPRLAFHLRSGRQVSVVNPPGSSPAVFNSLLVAVQQHLDANRGYRNA